MIYELILYIGLWRCVNPAPDPLPTDTEDLIIRLLQAEAQDIKRQQVIAMLEQLQQARKNQ